MQEERISKLETEIEQVKERNRRVELDKAWEISFTRALSICLLTYIVAVAFLVIIKDSNPYVHALVPVIGFYLSTQSLPIIKKWWSKEYVDRK